MPVNAYSFRARDLARRVDIVHVAVDDKRQAVDQRLAPTQAGLEDCKLKFILIARGLPSVLSGSTNFIQER
jgi:hypothetical protein